MFFRLSLVLSALFLLAVPASAACPVQGVEAIEEALDKAPSCDAALKMFEACGYGASIDAMFGGKVTEKCEGVFLSKLSSTQRKTYDREKEACTRKYAKEEGTMYRSFEAFCHAKLAAGYARKVK